MNVIFNKVPDPDSKNLVVWVNHFTADLFLKQGTNRFSICREIKTKRRCCVRYIGSDSNDATHK